MSILLAFQGLVGFSPIHFLVGFIILCCVLAIVIIGVKWLLGLTGLAVPQPLLVILGIIIFLVLFLCLIDWCGLYRF
jgi:hypothetical protein